MMFPWLWSIPASQLLAAPHSNCLLLPFCYALPAIAQGYQEPQDSGLSSAFFSIFSGHQFCTFFPCTDPLLSCRQLSLQVLSFTYLLSQMLHTSGTGMLENYWNLHPTDRLTSALQTTLTRPSILSSSLTPLSMSSLPLPPLSPSSSRLLLPFLRSATGSSTTFSCLLPYRSPSPLRCTFSPDIPLPTSSTEYQRPPSTHYSHTQGETWSAHVL